MSNFSYLYNTTISLMPSYTGQVVNTIVTAEYNLFENAYNDANHFLGPEGNPMDIVKVGVETTAGIIGASWLTVAAGPLLLLGTAETAINAMNSYYKS